MQPVTLSSGCRRLVAVAALGLVAATPAPADAPSDLWAQRQQRVAAAKEAAQSGDYAAALGPLKELAREVVPNHPRFLQQIVELGAETGDREAMLFGLRHLALSGLAWPPEASLGDAAEHSDVKRALVLASANRLPKGRADRWYQFPGPQPLVEGIAPAGQPGLYVAGDLTAPRLWRGEPRNGFDFWREIDGDPRLGVFALRLESSGARLLASLSEPGAGRHASSSDSPAIASVVLFDSRSGEELDRRTVPAGLGPCLLGDAAFGPGDTLFASDSVGGRLLVSRHPGEPFAPLGGERWPSPQGIVWDAARECLFVADYALGIFRCDPETGAATRLEAPPTAALAGLDGLYAYRGGLIAVQNGTVPERILWLAPDPSAERLQTVIPLLSGDRRLHDPTLGFVQDNRFIFVARSPWPYFSEDGFARPAREHTLILQLSLLPDHE